MRKTIVSTTIECGAAEITVTAEMLPGSRGTRSEPGSGPEINRIVGASRRCAVGCPHRSTPHDVSVDVDALEALMGPAAWAEVEDALLDAALNGESDGPDPDAARDA